jgi:dephospho-CoA kinase
MAKAKPVIGLVGDVCAGKSAVADAFRKQGAMVYDADSHVHELYKQADVIEQVKKLFGPSVIENGNVNRKALGKIVFADAEKLKVLTQQVVYPRTSATIDKKMNEFKASNAPALVLDAPTLFESGRVNTCDRIVYVTAPIERRVKWALNRGWDANELQRRQSKMTDENVKRSRADAVINNSGTLEELSQQVSALLKQWGAGKENASQ